MKKYITILVMIMSVETYAQAWWSIAYHEGSGTNSNTITRDHQTYIVNTDVPPPSEETKSKSYLSAKNAKAINKRLKKMNADRQAALQQLEEHKHNSGLISDCSACGGIGINPCLKCESNGFNACYACNEKKSVKCPACDGVGTIRDVETCRSCGGAGTISCNACLGEGKIACSSCVGLGVNSCSSCKGAGKVIE